MEEPFSNRIAMTEPIAAVIAPRLTDSYERLGCVGRLSENLEATCVKQEVVTFKR